jgi:hypothetical protein
MRPAARRHGPRRSINIARFGASRAIASAPSSANCTSLVARAHATHWATGLGRIANMLPRSGTCGALPSVSDMQVCKGARGRRRPRMRASRRSACAGPARLLSLQEQVVHQGPAWLDRIATEALARWGLGAEVRQAVAERREALVASASNRAIRNRVAKLCELERRAVGAEIAARAGLTFVARVPEGFRARIQPAEGTGPPGAYAEVSDGERFVVLRATPAPARLAGPVRCGRPRRQGTARRRTGSGQRHRPLEGNLLAWARPGHPARRRLSVSLNGARSSPRALGHERHLGFGAGGTRPRGACVTVTPSPNVGCPLPSRHASCAFEHA